MKPVKQKPTRQMPSARTLRVLLEVYPSLTFIFAKTIEATHDSRSE